MNKFIEKCFCDDQGKLTIAQFPNIPILLSLLFVILGFIPNLNSELSRIFSYLATSFLFVWAYLEITKGVNYFRKVMGIIVFVVLVISHLG